MGEIKPLGSEKLKNDEKIKRILELTYYKTNKDGSNKNSELIKESKSGGVYGIVKEKDGYYVKRGLNEQSLDYIGGLFMKNKNKFSSYAEALKRLELLKGQEELQEATKYVLKQNKPKEEAPMPEPSIDAPPPPQETNDVPPPPSEDMPPAPSDDSSAPSEETPQPDDQTAAPSNMQSGDSKRSEYMAEVQKYAGKLGQELRDQKEKMESDDIKYVLNMIISAVDLDKLELEDLEEIGKKFEREEEEGNESDEKPAEEPTPVQEPEPEPESEPETSPESEVTEYDYSMKELEEFINTPLDVNDSYSKDYDEEIDLSNYTDDVDEDIVELDLDEIKNQINKSVGETLSKYFK